MNDKQHEALVQLAKRYELEGGKPEYFPLDNRVGNALWVLGYAGRSMSKYQGKHLYVITTAGLEKIEYSGSYPVQNAQPAPAPVDAPALYTLPELDAKYFPGIEPEQKPETITTAAPAFDVGDMVRVATMKDVYHGRTGVVTHSPNDGVNYIVLVDLGKSVMRRRYHTDELELWTPDAPAVYTFTPEQLAQYDEQNPYPPYEPGATADDTLRNYEYQIAALKQERDKLRQERDTARQQFAALLTEIDMLNVSSSSQVHVARRNLLERAGQISPESRSLMDSNLMLQQERDKLLASEQRYHEDNERLQVVVKDLTERIGAARNYLKQIPERRIDATNSGFVLETVNFAYSYLCDVNETMLDVMLNQEG